MCEAVAIGAMIAGVVVSAASTGYSIYAQNKQAGIASAQARESAMLEAMQANMQRINANQFQLNAMEDIDNQEWFESDSIMRDASRLRGAGRVAFAGGGVDTSGGSPVLWDEQVGEDVARDIAASAYNYDQQRYGVEQEAAEQRWAGATSLLSSQRESNRSRSIRAGNRRGRVGSILAGAGQAAQGAGNVSVAGARRGWW